MWCVAISLADPPEMMLDSNPEMSQPPVKPQPMKQQKTI